MMKSIKLIIAILVLASIPLVTSIGVTDPYPQNIELMPGESATFVFQIQSQDFSIKCVPENLDESQGLEINLEKEYILEANQRLNVKGTVKLPSDMPYTNYKATFCILCTPSETGAGSAVRDRTCGLPITVTGVSERTMKNLFELEEEKETSLLWIILLFVILILIILIWYVLKKRK